MNIRIGLVTALSLQVTTCVSALGAGGPRWCVTGPGLTNGWSAGTFVNTLTQQTGCKPAADRGGGALVFHLGEDDFVKSLKLDLATLHPYGYYMVKRASNVALVSPTEKGLGYACTDFLKRFTGYRSFGTGTFGTVLPEVKEFKLPDEFTYREEPDVASVNIAGDAVWDASFARSQRLTCVSTHAMSDMVLESYYGTHPEYFPLINGTRQKPSGPWNPCMSNPDLPKLFRAYADRYFKENPEMVGLPMGVNDGGGDCCCETCLALYRKHGNQYVEFYNMAAKILAKEHPGKLLAFIAYWNAAQAPIDGYRMEPNILVEKTGHAWGLEAWRNAGVKHFGLYSYLYGLNSSRMAPSCCPRYIADYMRRQNKRYGLTTYWQELYPDTLIFDACRQYVLNEVLWDMDVDVERLIDDYHTSMFGPAAKEMKRFTEICDAAFADNDERGESFFMEWNNPVQFNGWTFERIAAADAALKAAQAAAPEIKVNLIKGLDDKPKSKPYAAPWRRVQLIAAVWGAMKPLMENWQTARQLRNAKDLDEAVRLLRQGLKAIRTFNAYRMKPNDEMEAFWWNCPGAYAHWSKQTKSRFAPLPPLEVAADAAFARVVESIGPEKAKAAFEGLKDDPEIGVYAQTQLALMKGGLVNIVKNGGFESIPEETVKYASRKDRLPFSQPWWSLDVFPNSHSEIWTDGTEAYSGRYSACLGENRSSCCLFQLVGVAPYTRYRLRLYVKCSDEGGRLGDVSIRLKTGGGSWLDQGASVTVPVPKAAIGQWAEISFFFTTPAGAGVMLPLISPPVQGPAGRMWVDDFSVEKICTVKPPPVKKEKPKRASPKVEEFDDLLEMEN